MIDESLVGNRFLFTGRDYDYLTGLYYHRARYRDAELGIWLSKDPAGFVDGLNLYQYVKGNPVQWKDPDGLMILNPPNINPPMQSNFDLGDKVSKGMRIAYLILKLWCKLLSCDDDPDNDPPPGGGQKTEYKCEINKNKSVVLPMNQAFSKIVF